MTVCVHACTGVSLTLLPRLAREQVWGMAISNLTALACVSKWCQMQPQDSRSASVFATCMLAVFVVMRTKASLEDTHFLPAAAA